MKLPLITQILESTAWLKAADSIPVEEPLLESFVNLASIDKGLLKAMRTKIFRYDQARMNDASSKQVLKPTIGRKSKVKVVNIIPTAALILSKFVADPDDVAIVVCAQDKQVLVIVNRSKLEGVDEHEDRLAVIANEDLFKNVIDREDFNKALGTSLANSMGKGNWKDIYQDKVNSIALLNDEKLPYVRRVLKHVLEAIREKNLEISLMYITKEPTELDAQAADVVAKAAVKAPSFPSFKAPIKKEGPAKANKAPAGASSFKPSARSST